MKQLELRARLWHIVDACGKIIRFISNKTREDYVADDLLTSAVERQLTIIGEAVMNIARVDTTIAAEVGDFPRIIAFRNQLVHNYPGVDHDAVWLIVQREVPVLLERVGAILARLGGPGAPAT